MKTIKTAFRNHHSENYDYNAMNAKFKSIFGLEAKSYLKTLRKMFVDELFPTCEKVVFNIWTGTRNYFYLTLKDSENNILCRMTVDRGYSASNYKFRDITKTNEDAILAEVAKYNAKVFKSLCKKAGVCEKASREVVLTVFRNYKATGETKVLKGNVYDIIDYYVTLNDRLKYINGSYYNWQSNEMQKVYEHFIYNYKGNYFLANAVSRGCIID